MLRAAPVPRRVEGQARLPRPCSSRRRGQHPCPAPRTRRGRCSRRGRRSRRRGSSRSRTGGCTSRRGQAAGAVAPLWSGPRPMAAGTPVGGSGSALIVFVVTDVVPPSLVAVQVRVVPVFGPGSGSSPRKRVVEVTVEGGSFTVHLRTTNFPCVLPGTSCSCRCRRSRTRWPVGCCRRGRDAAARRGAGMSGTVARTTS
jgi:hypothetical protein